MIVPSRGDRRTTGAPSATPRSVDPASRESASTTGPGWGHPPFDRDAAHRGGIDRGGPPGPAVTVDVHLAPGWQRQRLVEDVRRGLLEPAGTKSLPPVWFYDDRGSALFDAITTLPEYYPTRAEAALLQAHAAEMAELVQAATVVELGAGTCTKTRIVLRALRQRGCLRRYVPMDVSEATLRQAAEELAGEMPGLQVRAVVGDFHRHLHRLPMAGRTAVAFLGGTIGNLGPAERQRFLAELAGQLDGHDTLVLGTDLVKDPDRLVAAYDDHQGVTAAFNRNVLAVLNRELGADFDLDAFAHVARWDAEQQWIEMRLRAIGRQRVALRHLDAEVTFDDGEELLTEISAKFTPARVAEELAAAGLAVRAMWDQPGGEFLLTVAGPG
jgi:L-histidine N-alpha-methyltransferase